MARKKKIEFKEQVYDIGNDATVTIRYRADARPRMVHNDTCVTVGEEGSGLITPRPLPSLVPFNYPTTNGPDHDTPEILAMKASLPKRKVFSSKDTMGADFDPDDLIGGVNAGAIPVLGETSG